MQPLQLHADRRRPALVRAAELPWLASPEAGVERRPLERIGGEVALATSIVRYRAGSRFARHTHELGEEFLVLDGVFSDELGHYPVGTYVRNPPGSAHAPFSEAGCVIFVKLRQMRADDTDRVVVHADQRQWRSANEPGLMQATLHERPGLSVSLERLAPGSTLPATTRAGGMEVLVVEGAVSRVSDDAQSLGAWGWLRQPGLRQPALGSATGALLWIKRGHLPAPPTEEAHPWPC
ncbi:MAG: cupin domain-containing protein [Rhizobacter sp.]